MSKKKPKKKARYRYRDARTGEILSQAEFRKRDKATTVRERIRSRS